MTFAQRYKDFFRTTLPLWLYLKHKGYNLALTHKSLLFYKKKMYNVLNSIKLLSCCFVV